MPCIGGKENVMKAKKILSAVLSAAMCCSFLTANVSANDVDLSIPTESYISLAEKKVNENTISVSALPDGCQLEDIIINPANLNGISTYSNSGISTYSSSGFVLGLNLSAANPETVINGSATTDTILYWLWSNGSEDYTYDPDGYDIVEHYVLGIDNYMLGTLSIGGEVVGFATQFTEAGPQDFQYYAENSNGDIWGTTCSITIEPANGNSRPAASLSAYGQSYVNSEIVFDWSNSSDTDGDTIVDGRIRVYVGDDYEVATEESSQYYVSKTSTSATLKFPSDRQYTLWLSVSDNHNNWSDWLVATISIDKNPIITLADTSWSDSKVVRSKPVGSNSYVYHTLWSRLGGEICVDGSKAVRYSSYTNHNGTYYNVYIAPIAAGTLFSCAETWTSSSNENVYTDPIFGGETPRRITQAEINYLMQNKYHYYIVYTADYKVVDFYSELNPLIMYGWSQVSYK